MPFVVALLFFWPLVPVLLVSNTLGMALLVIALAIPFWLLMTYGLAFVLSFPAAVFDFYNPFVEAMTFRDTAWSHWLADLSVRSGFMHLLKFQVLYLEIVSELAYRLFGNGSVFNCFAALWPAWLFAAVLAIERSDPWKT